MAITMMNNDPNYFTVRTADIIIQDDKWHEINDLKINIEKALSHPQIISEASLSVLLTNDTHIQQLNHDFRGMNKATNVLSFPADEDGFLGDIAIALETLMKEAEAQNKQFYNHFIHILIHGILHLKGYDHETDAQAEEMESLEIQILEDMGIKNPYK